MTPPLYTNPSRYGLRLTVASSLVLLISCSETGSVDECPPSDPAAIVGLANTTHLRLAGEALGREGFNRYEEVEPGSTVPVDEYLLSVTTNVVLAENSRPGVLGKRRGWFLGTAQASCAPPSVISVQRLGAIDLRSDATVSGSLPAGTSLSAVARIAAFFEVVHDARFGEAISGMTIFPAFSSEQALGQFGADAPSAPLTFGIQLATELDAAGEHRFTVDYALTNGETFSVLTEPVMLSPAAP